MFLSCCSWSFFDGQLQTPQYTPQRAVPWLRTLQSGDPGLTLNLKKKFELFIGSVHTTHAGKIWNHNFISTARPTVHTNTPRKRSASKTLLKSEKFEKCGFSFSCGRKHFEKGAFRKQWYHDNHAISPIMTEFSSNTNPKWSAIFPSILLWGGVDGEHLMRFQSVTTVSKFLPVWTEPLDYSCFVILILDMYRFQASRPYLQFCRSSLTKSAHGWVTSYARARCMGGLYDGDSSEAGRSF